MPGFETRHCVTRAAWRSTLRMSGFQTDIPPSTHSTVVWNAYEHIILQYEDMNMQDARFLRFRSPPKKRKPKAGIHLVSDHSTPLRYVNTIQEFTDILVPYATDSLDRCSCRRNRSAQRQERKGEECVPDWETLEMSLPSMISSSF